MSPDDDDDFDVFDSIDLQQKRARELFEAAEARAADEGRIIDPAQHRQFAAARFFRHCRLALGLDVHQAVEGPLHGTITERRLRRCENGVFAFPPRAWEIMAQELADAGRRDLVLMMRKAGWLGDDQMARPSRSSSDTLGRTGT
jgi:hypothetical protein